MKKQFITYLSGTAKVLAMAVMLVSCKKDLNNASKSNTAASSLKTTAPRAVTYQLVWSDEFNGTSVDQTKWNIDTGNPGVNNEEEYYQAANVTETGGNLVITAKQQSVGGQPYTSAMLYVPQYGHKW